MNKLLTNLSAAGNKHVMFPVYLAAALEVASVWLPQYKAQINDTQRILILYGIASAANSAPKTVDKPDPGEPR